MKLCQSLSLYVLQETSSVAVRVFAKRQDFLKSEHEKMQSFGEKFISESRISTVKVEKEWYKIDPCLCSNGNIKCGTMQWYV